MQLNTDIKYECIYYELHSKLIKILTQTTNYLKIPNIPSQKSLNEVKEKSTQLEVIHYLRGGRGPNAVAVKEKSTQ
jgi:hypothetical protein